MSSRIFSPAISLLMIGIIVGFTNMAKAQNLKEQFKVVNRELSLNQKTGVIHLNERGDAGIAWILDKEFTNGTIEFEVKGKDVFQGSFIGIAFHGLNDTTYEAVYFRPFNFRATDPVRKAHAVQYIANPKYDWPKLREEFPGKYEQPVPSSLDPNQWFHVKIKVSDKWLSVYVNGSKNPVLEVQSLVETGGKMIGYWVGDSSGADWRNLKITNK